MKIEDIRAKSEKDLLRSLAESRDKLRDLRFKVSSREHKSYKDLSKLKKDIAQILTILKEKELIKKGS